MAEQLLVVGAGGHARVCAEVIDAEGVYRVGGFVGLPEEVGRELDGRSVLGTDRDLEELSKRFRHALIGIGQISSSETRRRLFGEVRAMGYTVPAVCSPMAWVSSRASLGPGSIVMHGAVVNPGATIGLNCIVNSSALVEHDAVIGDHCHVSTGAVVNGGVRVGERTFLGSGCVIRDGVTIGAECFIGMGARITKDVASGSRVL